MRPCWFIWISLKLMFNWKSAINIVFFFFFFFGGGRFCESISIVCVMCHQKRAHFRFLFSCRHWSFSSKYKTNNILRSLNVIKSEKAIPKKTCNLGTYMKHLCWTLWATPPPPIWRHIPPNMGRWSNVGPQSVLLISPLLYPINIFPQLKLWPAIAAHNFNWGKITHIWHQHF